MYNRRTKPAKTTYAEKIPMRQIVYIRDNFTCQGCGKNFRSPNNYKGYQIKGLTLGHIIPRCLGGLFVEENLRAQCYKCNQELGDKIWEKELRKALTHYVLK